jgi:L-2,4-diaminobutyrate transaminase
LSGSIISKRVFDVIAQGTDDHGPLGHGWTYSAHPVSAAAGVATLELVDSMGLVENAAETGPYMLDKLREAVGDHPNVAEVRGVGLMAAVELMDDPAAGTWFPEMTVGPEVSAAMLRRGVIARAMPQGNMIGFAPPLCITRDEVDIVARALRDALHEVLPA